jgi:hypothetical protein
MARGNPAYPKPIIELLFIFINSTLDIELKLQLILF